MYGPPSHVDPQSQSFHEFWGQFFGNAVTLAFKK